MTNATNAGNPASDYMSRPLNTPTIGQLVLLPSSHIKPNQPLVHTETGEIEVVNKDKYFDPQDYSRYYLVTDERPTSKNLVFIYNAETGDADIRMYRENMILEEGFEMHVCYPAANSIVRRLHDKYYERIKDGKIEYLRFTKIHNGKYAGFPSRTNARIPATQANERWDYIFQHILLTNPTNPLKTRIGLLFGSISDIDLTSKDTVNLLNKYRTWILG